jgi:BlaI family penicillinase repressor
MKNRERTRVTDAELAVLEVLWARGGLSIREIADAVYPGGGASEYSTVQKLLERLEGKGCISRDRRSFAHTFVTRVDRGHLIRDELEELAAKLCEGSFTPLLVHLVKSRKLRAEDRAELRRILEDEELRRRKKP